MFKRWTLLVFWSLFILLGTVVLINVTVDADGIFRTDFSSQFQPPNMSYVKIRFLSEKKHSFDSFLFGSSRIGSMIHIDRISSGHYYNMFYPGGLPEEHLEHIKFLLKIGVPVRNVIIGLDDFSYLFDPKQHLSELDLQPHPAVSGKNLTTFYLEYFFRLRGLLPQLEAYVRYNYLQSGKPRRYVYDIYRTGTILCSDCDARIERDVKAHVNSSRFLEPADYRYVDGEYIAFALSAIREIADLANKNRFNLIVLINPIHKITYLNADLKQFALFKKQLAEITDYYDFSGLNSITENNYFYYETSHYRPIVGDMMLKVMLGEPDVAVPRDFGFHVTRHNIDAHIREQCREIRGVRNNLYNTNRAYADSCQESPNRI